MQGESCDPAVLEPVLRNPRLRRAAAYFGSERKNAAFEELLRARGIEKFEDSPFEYE